jgi:hypothetical protein
VPVGSPSTTLNGEVEGIYFISGHWHLCNHKGQAGFRCGHLWDSTRLLKSSNLILRMIYKEANGPRLRYGMIKLKWESGKTMQIDTQWQSIRTQKQINLGSTTN